MYFFIIILFYFIVDTVASSVDSTKKVAESSIATGKSYVDSAKGKSSTILTSTEIFLVLCCD